MNPLDLRGPEFLAFYLVFGGAVLLGLHLWGRAVESSALAPRIDLSDPYLIAYLQGGSSEALKVGVISLLDRGLLVEAEGGIRSSDPQAPERAARPFEKAILRYFEHARPAHEIFEYGEGAFRGTGYLADLEALRLVPDEGQSRARTLRLLAGLGCLWGLALLKIGVALSRGHANVLFLVVLAGLFGVLARGVVKRRLTALGRSVLEDLRLLYRDLPQRAAFIQPGGGSTEAVMLAAVFGAAALPALHFPFVKRHFPRTGKAGSGWSLNASSCGASCGTSSGSSCGSSCGGGGCGGGCGGCGS